MGLALFLLSIFCFTNFGVLMRKILGLFIIWCLGAGVSNAALITYSYTAIDASFDASSSLLDYITTSSSVTSTNVTEFTEVNSEEDSVSMVEFTFNLGSSTSIDFFAGVDANFGGEIYVNGVQVFDTEDDLWWRRSWTHSDVMSTSDVFNGFVDIQILWAEECCGGLSSIAMSSSALASGFNELSIANLETLESSSIITSVHAPSSILILSLGIVFAGFRRFSR